MFKDKGGSVSRASGWRFVVKVSLNIGDGVK